MKTKRKRNPRAPAPALLGGAEAGAAAQPQHISAGCWIWDGDREEEKMPILRGYDVYDDWVL